MINIHLLYPYRLMEFHQHCTYIYRPILYTVCYVIWQGQGQEWKPYIELDRASWDIWIVPENELYTWTTWCTHGAHLWTYISQVALHASIKFKKMKSMDEVLNEVLEMTHKMNFTRVPCVYMVYTSDNLLMSCGTYIRCINKVWLTSICWFSTEYKYAPGGA